MNAPTEVLPSRDAELRAWSEQNQRWLTQRFASLRLRIEQYSARLGEDVEPASAPCEGEADTVSNDPHAAGFIAALERVVTLFGLSPFERDLLLLAAGIELDSALRHALAHAQGMSSTVARGWR